MGRAALIVDSSAILAILLRESDGPAFFRQIKTAARPRMSTASYVESTLRLGGLSDRTPLANLDPLLEKLGVVLESLTVEHAYAARAAGERYGKGHHPAKLNYGDCFSYALAKVSGEPLLFKGNDFSQTDIGIALPQ